MAGLIQEIVDIPFTVGKGIVTAALTVPGAYEINVKEKYIPGHDALTMMPKGVNNDVDTFAKVHLRYPLMVPIGVVGTVANIFTLPVHVYHQIEGNWNKAKEAFDGKYPLPKDYLPEGKQGLLTELFDFPVCVINTGISGLKAVQNSIDINWSEKYSPKHDPMISLPKQFNRGEDSRDTFARRLLKPPAIAVVGAAGTAGDIVGLTGHALKELYKTYKDLRRGASSAFPTENDFKPRAKPEVINVIDYKVE